VKELWLQYRPTREHLFRFLAALGLGLVVWVYVTISQNPETQIVFEDLPLSSIGLPPQFVLTDAQGLPLNSLGSVSLTARAPQEESLDPSSFRAHVNMSAIQEPGVYELEVEVEAPRAVRTWTVSPDKVIVRVERLEQRIFPIEVLLQDKPGIPYEVGTPSVNPSQAMVEGPASRIARIDGVQARVNLAGRVASLENVPVTLIALSAADEDVDGVVIIPGEAEVDVPINLEGGHRVVSIVPVTAGQPAAGYFLESVDVFPNTATILSGDPRVLDDVLFLQTAAIDITGQSQNFSRTVGLSLPPNISLFNSPSLVTVTVRFDAIQSLLRVEVPVRLVGLQIPLEATWRPQWLSIQIQAPLEVLQGLALDELWANVEVSDLDAGEYDLIPVFQVPAGVEITPAGPITVHVVIVRPPTPTPTPSITPTPTIGPSPPPRPTATPTPTASPTVAPTATSGIVPTESPLPSPTPSGPPPPTNTPTPDSATPTTTPEYPELTPTPTGTP
jgi:YbbR domain-containing protein